MTTARRTIAQVVAEQEPAIVRVIAYCRISRDPQERFVQIRRQQEEIKQECERQTARTGVPWVVVRTVVDDNRSNSLARKRDREAFSDLLDEIEAGTTDADAVAFFDQERFVKDPLDWARWIVTAFDPKRRMRVLICGTGEVDLSTMEGFAASGFQMINSNMSTILQVKRIRSHTKEQSANGKIPKLLYGWKRVIVNDDRGYRVGWYDELHPVNSLIVQEIIRRIIARESSTSICRDLDKRGVPTPNAGQKRAAATWTVGTITRIAERSANIGVRVDEDGNETPIANPAIVTRAEWMRVKAILRDPRRRTQTSTNVVHLLSHIAVCGRCDGPMRRTRLRNKRYDTEWIGYVCIAEQHVGIKQADTDEAVVSDVLDWLREVDPSDLIEDGGELTLALDELTVLSDELAGYIADSKRPLRDPLRVSKRELDERRALLVPQIEDARRRSERVSSVTVAAAASIARADDVEAAWDSLALGVRRSIIDEFFTVRIMPSDPTFSRRKFDGRRVVVARKTSD